MKRKFLFAALISSLLVTMNVNAGVIFNKTNAVLVGGTVFAAYSAHKATQQTLEYLKDNPIQVTNYFKQFPENYESVKKAVLKFLPKVTDYDEYLKYKKVADKMGINNIPGFNPPAYNQPKIYQNPQQNDDSNYVLEHPSSDYETPRLIKNPQGEIVVVGTEFPYENIKTWDDYLLVKSHSQELADNLDAIALLKNPNYVRPGNVAAHHIIPATALGAKDARDILDKYGISFNDVINGVYLPNDSSSSMNGIIHKGRHPNIYVDKVNDLIVTADKFGGENGVINELKRIRNILQNASKNENWRNLL